jgi:cytoplasmic iron level regulating protein YaaA (DUF328/UPF0246 family)
VLVLLPASDAKVPVPDAAPFDPAGLSFPSLAPARAAVLEALIEVSAEPGATRRLSEAPSQSDVVRRNVALRDAPAAPAAEIYAGVLYEALGLGNLDAASRRRAHTWVAVISALWGDLRLDDRIPAYRLNMCGRLPGFGHLPDVWRAALIDVLPAAAGRGLVVDFRSAEYATAWRPTGGLAERTVIVKVVREGDRSRGAGGHHAKRTRGLVARRILTDAIDPRRPNDLADALSPHFELELLSPDRPARPSELRVVERLP